jgi:DNA-binding transcriptional LysR family regulator
MNIKTFDLNLLRVLEALLDTQSTVKAGEKIGLSQPAISAALGRLRTSLNDPLLVREGQKLVPTQKAKKLRPKLKSLMREVEYLIEPDTFDPQSAQNSFIISGSDFFCRNAIAAFK